jgi:ABC-type bacteriocin/lantibiotic exporter with double-glycine peptidase domain
MEDWASTCRITNVMQEDTFGCGVACLAMIAKLDYASARLTFLSYGFGSENRPNGRAPFATNFKELLLVLGEHTLDARMKRWRGWDQFEGIGIIKVKCGPGARKNDWHWVVAEKHERYGVVVYDPMAHQPSFRKRPPEGVQSQPFKKHVPFGNWISVRKP